jgi:hypothetical protein
MHYYGDIHQPLHCNERYSKNFIQGDVGGTAFKLKRPVYDLHKLWDRLVRFKSERVQSLPFNETGW